MALVFFHWEPGSTSEAQRKEITEKITAAIIKEAGAKGAFVAFQDQRSYPPAAGPILFINWTEGQSHTVKDAVVSGVTGAVCGVTGLNPANVKIIFRDIPRGNLANNGVIINRKPS